MKKSGLSGLFDQDDALSDKSLLTYQRPRQPGSDPALVSSEPSPPAPELADSPLAHESSPQIPSQPQPPSPQTLSNPPPPAPVAATPPPPPASPELLFSSVVTAFSYSGSQSVPLGSLGCALYWEPRRALLVLYRSREKQLCLLTLTQAALPAPQPNLYVNFTCDAGRPFSVRLPSPDAVLQLMMKAMLAVTLQGLAGGAAPPPLAVTLPGKGDPPPAGRAAARGDTLALEVAEWSAEPPSAAPYRRRGGAVSESGCVDGTWRGALLGCRAGQRLLVLDPADRTVRQVAVRAVRPAPRTAALRLEGGVGWEPPDPAEALQSDSPAEGTRGGEGAAEREAARAAEVEEVGREAEVPATEEEVGAATPAAAAPGRADVLSRVARLGQQMFPPAATSGGSAVRPAARPRSPSPSPRSPPASPRSPPAFPGPTSPAAAPDPPPRPQRRRPSSPAARPDLTELAVALGRVEAKLDAVAARVAPSGPAEAEALAAGVRRLGEEAVRLQAEARQAADLRERLLEAERSRAALAEELTAALAELADTRRSGARWQRELASAQERAAELERAAGEREGEQGARGGPETRRLLKGVYKTLRAKFPPDGSFSGVEVCDVIAEVMRQTFERLSGEEGSRPAPEVPEVPGREAPAPPPFVREDECVKEGDD